MGAADRICCQQISGSGAVVRESLGDGRAGVRLPPAVVEGLGDDWTWEVAVLGDGRVLASCAPA